jgi:aspartyl-tRNA(Asn)/glutamyl-tRNA(Gln) amidotransferase subunit A
MGRRAEAAAARAALVSVGVRWSRRAFARVGALGALGGLAARRPLEAQRDPVESSEPLTSLSLAEASELVRGGKLSPTELTRACLARIEALDSKLNSFITVTADAALTAARQAEAEIRRGDWRGPLHGIPIALKDLVDTQGVLTTAGSRVFAERVPGEDAEVVRRLKAAGAVLVGKLNMHEFAYGASTVVSAFGAVHNPWALERSAGGSSAGSAAAVAAGLCYGAIGSDTGGSIRQPAAYCGIVGMKPSFGLVSTRGVVPLAWSLDHVGPMTRRVRDCALMLQVLAGPDGGDARPTAPALDYAGALEQDPGLRLGVPREHFWEDLDSDIEAATSAALHVLVTLGGRARDVTLEAGNDAAVAVLRAEAYAYHEPYVARSPGLYQAETLRRIQRGADVTAAVYIGARRQIEALQHAACRLFETVDLLVTPTTPVPPPAIAEVASDMDSLRARELAMLRNTRPWNALGLPTISVPCGFTKDGVPIGLQISGAPGDDSRVLALAHAYEQATDWHRKRLPLGA